MKMKKLTSTAAIIAALSATPALAQLTDWDANGDGVMSEAEFSAAFAERGVFDRWDDDNDGKISIEEFDTGVYRTFDADRSGDLTATEYGVNDLRAPRYWVGNEVRIGAWDIDGDGIILANEFSGGLADMNLLATWDTNGDGALSEDEFSTGVFFKYDENNDGIIEEPELTDIGDDMGDGGFWDI